MAEDIQKPLNLKKSFLKKDNEEEPIIVAQRFLNIFRQLHIFTAERKDAFNAMILELHPEIRGMFGSLPGGSVLQEYVDELEQKSGISRDKTSSISTEISEEISKAKILATALAEAQIAAANRNQQAQVASIPPQQPQQERVRTATTEARTSTSERIVADASFAKEIASAVKEAIMYTESTRRKETDEITKVLATSQAKLAQMVMQNNSAAASSSSNNNANNIQINTAATFPPIEDMVSGIVRAQSELFREMAKTQTAELSAIISVALKESQQLSSQTIVEAIKAFQKENLKVLGLRAATRDFEDDEIIPPVKTKKKKAEPKEIIEEPIEEDEEVEEIFEPVEKVQDIAKETVTEIPEEAPKKKKKKKKKKKNKTATEDLDLAPPSPLQNQYEYIVAKNVDELPTESSDNDNEWEWEYEEVPLDELPNGVANSNLDISLFDSEIKEPKSSGKNLDLSIFDNETKKSGENEEISEDEFEWEYEEVEVEEEAPVESILENKIEASALVEEDEQDWEWEYETVEETIEEAPDPTDNIILAEEKEDISTFDFDIEEDDETISEEETISKQQSDLTDNKFGFSNKEDAFDAFSLGIDNSPIELNLDEELELEVTEEDTFEFIEPEIEKETLIELNLENENISTEEKFKIESETSTESIQTQEVSNVKEVETSETEEDWEWEYEEVEAEDEAPIEPIQALEATVVKETETSEAEEDWEWEYEEVEAEDEAPVEPIQTLEAAVVNEAKTSEAEEDWEWEYEEVEAEDEAPVEPIQTLEADVVNETETSETEEDWEWEYEEVEDEDEAPAEIGNDNNQNNLTNSFTLSDPYQKLIPEAETATDEEVVTGNLSAIYTGEVYFQEDVLSGEQSKAKEINELSNLIDAEIGIPELNKDDNNEPYKPKII